MIDFDKIDRSVPILESKGLCKYFGGLKAVENVDMKVMAGDIFGIIGPNGAGKTTFFNMCTGMYTPTKGKVYLMGPDSHLKGLQGNVWQGPSRTCSCLSS